MELTTRNLSDKMLNGPEYKLVEQFITSQDYFKEDGLEYTIIREVQAEIGIPDILILVWDKNALKNWKKERLDLDKSDIKILHHISNKGKRGEDLINMVFILGYSKKQIDKTVNKLIAAGLIVQKGGKVFTIDLTENFFIRKIIAIEAKVRDWKKAIFQAQLNENFSSHSYVLLPNEYISPKVKSSFNKEIGLLGQAGDKTILKKKARKGNLPKSYFSWVINEYIGRQLYESNQPNQK